MSSNKRTVQYFVALIIGCIMFGLGVFLRPAIVSSSYKFWNRVCRVYVKTFGDEPINRQVRVITAEQSTAISSAVKISFVGDLILLRDSVAHGYHVDTSSYCYDSVFAKAKKYWQDSDLVIGVFEGPLAGHEYPYTTSTFDGDGIPAYLNFPDSFAASVKNAGIGLVTTANNHLLDRGVAGAMRTLDVLDNIGLDHTGSYRDDIEYEAIKIVTCRGKRIAVLSYTYGSNYTDESFFFDKSTCYVTRPIVDLKSRFLKENVSLVERDFARAKLANPDIILVLPHMGEQHRHWPDENQKFWCDVFVKNGADIILSDHPHNIQPIEWRRHEGKAIPIVYCPGNFTNSYTKQDDDVSMIVEVYLSADSFHPFAVGIVPLYAYGEPHGNYVALPLYDVATNLNYTCSMSRGEVKRAKDAQSIATQIVLGHSIALENAHPRYFLYPDGAVATPLITPIDVSNERRKSRILDEIERANSICFVGDSITEGTMNGGYGWYEPIMANYPEKNVSRFAKGSMTSKYFATKSDSIAKIGAELYVLSFGCNDIRYRDPKLCAMTDTEYIEQIRILVEAIRKANPKSRMICVAPWISASHDKNCKCSLVEKEKLYHAYTKALAAFCQNEGIVFVDPNPIVEGILRKAEGMGVMLDYIHPGAAIGVHLYSKACLESN